MKDKLNNNEEKKKYTYSIGSLIKHLKEGNDEGKDLIIPEYQRDYVWSESKVPLLLDSIFRGYPIGAIVTWEGTENNVVHLLDGLQRSFSIVKISNDFDKYVSAKLLESSITSIVKEKDENLLGDEYDILVGYKSDIDLRIEALYKTIRNDGLELARNGLIEEQGNTKSDNKVRRIILKLFIDAIDKLIDFRDNGFNEYKIDRIVIDPKLKKKDVTEIFERLNTGAKTLNNFEVYASHWSNHPLSINGGYVKKFIRDRKERYAQVLGIEYDESSSFKKREIVPSDYIYATLITTFQTSDTFKAFFLKENDNGIFSLKNIEELTYIFLNYFGLSNDEVGFKNLGRTIKMKMDDEESTNFRTLLKKSIDMVEKNLTFFKFAKVNLKDYKNVKDNLKISTHLITSMVNQVMNKLKVDENFKLKKNQLNYWLVSEMISKAYSTGPGNVGILATKNAKYVNEMPKSLAKRIINFADEESEKQIRQPSSASKTILAFIQTSMQLKSDDLHIDHVIPQSKLRDAKIWSMTHSLYNIQLLEEGKNIDKNDSIIPDDYQYDFLANSEFMNDTDKQNYKDLIEKCNFDLKNNFVNFFEFRKEKIKDVIKKVFG